MLWWGYAQRGPLYAALHCVERLAGKTVHGQRVATNADGYDEHDRGQGGSQRREGAMGQGVQPDEEAPKRSPSLLFEGAVHAGASLQHGLR